MGWVERAILGLNDFLARGIMSNVVKRRAKKGGRGRRLEFKEWVNRRVGIVSKLEKVRSAC